jgi:hypothetical protein
MCHVEIKFRKFKVLPLLHVQILITKDRKAYENDPKRR